MSRKQPSLRHFAIIARTFRSKAGTLWEVKDRRSPDASQYLFTPGFLTSWPRWVAILGDSCSPIKLRNGKVALLLSRELDFDAIAKSLKYPRGRRNYRLLPMVGFLEVKGNHIKLVLSMMLVLVLIAGLATMAMSPKAIEIASAKQTLHKVQKTSCGEVDLLGQSLPTNMKAHSIISVKEIKYRILEKNTFGGLTQIQLRRMCDGKKFHLEAWRDKDSLEVSKIS